jgi:hypothetical protein
VFMAGRLVPSPIPGTSLESACGWVSTDSARSSTTRASRRLEPLSPPRDCRGQLSGLSGRRSQATRPWRHRQLQTAANSMCPEAWPIFRARHDTVICEMWPVCCPTWESSPRAQSTRGGITTEVALYIVDRGSRWGAVRSVVTNAGYHGNRAGESLQNWPSGHEAVVPQASRTTDARFLAYSRRNPSPRRVSGGQSTPPRHGKLALRCFSVPESCSFCPGSCACQRP